MIAEPKTYVDQMGYKVSLASTPKRIISLVPSQTELLAYLGADEEVVGITKFCIHPEGWFKTKERIGGTKNLDMAKIERLKPDLIIGNKEENKEDQIKELMQRYPVWMSDIHQLTDALDMIKNVGKFVDKYEKANELAESISSNFKQFSAHNTPSHKVAYFIWRDPYMSVGKNSFINHIMELCNFENVFINKEEEYPIIKSEDIEQAAPELILLSSEPFPFKEKHKAEFKAICPKAKVMLVDGEYFSWYGSRLLNTPAYLNGVLKEMNDAQN